MAFPLLCWIRLSLHICSQKLTNKSPGQRQTNNHSTILVTRGLLMHGNTSIFGRLSERDGEREKERIQEITNSHCSTLTKQGKTATHRLQKKRAPDCRPSLETLAIHLYVLLANHMRDANDGQLYKWSPPW